MPSLDEWLNKRKDQELASKLVALSDVNPDLAAQSVKQARENNIPPAMMPFTPDPDLSQQARLRDVSATVQSSKNLREWMNRQPDVVAASVQDDVDNMSMIDALIDPIIDAARAAATGLPRISQGFYGAAAIPFGILRSAAEPFSGTRATIPLLPMNPFAAPEEYLLNVSRGQKELAELVAGDRDESGVISRGIYAGFESIGQNIPALAAGVITKNPNVALTALSATTTGIEYEQARQKLDVGQAVSYATLQGAIEYATEKIPVSALLKDVNADETLLRTFGRQLLLDVPGEQVATVLQDLNQWANLNPDKPFKDYLAERPSAAAETLIATIVGVGGNVAITKAVGALVDRDSSVQKANDTARLLGELNALATASVVRERDVETFEGFLQTVTQDTPVESLFIDAQTLIDSGLSEKLAAQSPTVAEQLPQAQAGTMIRIPTSEVMGRFNQDLAALLPDMRTDPNGMSQKEADEYVATRGDQLRAEVESVLAQSENDQAAQEARARVRDTVAQELMATGRVTQDVADNYALLTSTFYHVMGRRMGMDAEQLFGQERLRVAGVGRGEFEQVRQPVASLADAEQAIASGSRVIATTDAGEVDVTNVEDLQAYTPEQLSIVQQGAFLQTPAALPNWSREVSEGVEITDEVKKGAISIAPKASLAQRNYEKLDAIFAQVPNPLESEDSWRKFMSLLVADQSVLGVPYTALKYAQNPQAVADYLKTLRPDQLESRRNGFKLGAAIRQQYADGNATPVITGRLLLWAMLSRKAGAYPHEAAYMDLVNGGVDQWIEKAASGKWTEKDGDDYAKWSMDFMASKKGGVSPGAGVTSNANDFGRILLSKLSQKDENGVTGLVRLHNLIANQNVSTDEVRRAFFALGDSVGIQNKVLSFALLVTGRWDTLVLDRVQFTHLWGDTYRERSGQRNIYDGTEGGLAAAGEGHFGVAIYEALARGLTESVARGYEIAGLDGQGDGSLGAFHWDSWLIESSQAIGHPTVEALATDRPRPDLAVRQGKFDTYSYNFEYRADGQYQIPLLDGSGYRIISPAQAAEFADRISDQKEGVVPKNFKVSKNKTSPWVDAEGVNRGRYDEILNEYGRQADAGDVPPAGSPDAARPIQQPATITREEGEEFLQGEPQEIKGSFSPSELTIRLTKAQDLSTFLHESGHFYLHMLVNLASRPDAPEDVRKDAETILNWFGIKATPEMGQFDVWLNMSTDEQRPSHERFARAFEVYLAEGKAPSTELQPMFDRFRSWLLNIYRAFMERAKAAMGKQVSFGKAMQAELNDEVRAVFDRMLATQEEIEAKEAAQSLGMMFKTEEEAQKFGIDWNAYQAQGEAATQQAITELTAKSVQDMKWLENARSRLLSKLQREEKETRRAVRATVRPEIMSQPIYQAWTYLTGTLTDDPNAEPASRFDPEFVEQVTASKEVVEMLRRRRMVATSADVKKGVSGEHPDVVAETFGFSSGYELIQAILAAPTPDEAINAETDARMLRDFSDLSTEQGRNDAVNAALANDARARMVETELAALEKAMSPTAMIGGRRQRTLPGAARNFARSVINRLKIRDVRVGQFSGSASRAARNADRAIKRGNIAEAALEKRNQLVNNYAAKFAGEALDNVKSGLAYLRKFAKEGTRKNIDVEYLDQIDRILERFDLRQKSLRELDRRDALAKFIEDQRELGIEPDIPDYILNEAQAVNYKNLTVEEFAGLVDSVRQIEHMGRLKRKLLLAKDKREFAALMAEIEASVIANDKGRVADNETRNDIGNILSRAFKAFTAAHRKMASIVYELDGFKDGGPLWNALVRPANERGNWEASKQAELTMRLAKLLDALPGKRENRFSKGIYFQKINRSLNQERRLAVALNWGNEGNRQRLMDGYGWTEEGVQQVLDSLSKEEWDFVQGVWDTFESLRPDIAKVERDLMGKEPEWVAATPVQTSFGTYRGGYYPAVYDPRQNLRAEQMEAEELAKRQLRGARTAATVRSSFVKGRAAEVKGRPLLLTMDATFNGLTDVVHYLAYKEWLIDANRILRAVDPTIRARYGAEMVSQLRTAVEAIAAGEATNPHALDKFLNHIRIGSMVAGLGFNIVNALMQPVGLTQSIVRVGPKYIAQGVAAFAKNPVKLATAVLEKSEFMQNRKRTQNRELNELRNNIRGKTETRQFIDAAMFLPMTAVQMTVDIPTWWGAYQKAQTDGFDEETSIQIADQAVIASQGGGQTKDLAAIQRGGEFVKLFTVFYGYFNTAYNLGVERIRGTNYRSPAQIARLATDLLLIYSLPAVMTMFIKDALKIGDEDDDEEIAKKLAAEQISFLFGTMVGVREAAGAAQIAFGLSTSGGLGYNGPAGLRFYNELNKFSQQASQGEIDRAFVRAGVNVAGIALHLPSAQINRTIDGVVAMSEGRTENPVALVGGAPPQ